MIPGIKLQNGSVNESVRGFLARLMESGRIKAIVGLSRSSKSSASFAIVTRPEDIEGIDPFIPDYPVQGAEIVKRMTFVTPSPEKVLFILRPCEIRAVVELSKLNQVQLKNLYFMSMDCPGALKSSYIIANGLPDGEEFLRATMDSENLRRACRTCEEFIPMCGADLRLSALEGEPAIFSLTDKGNELIENATELPPPELSKIMEQRASEKNKDFDLFEKKFKGAENLLETLSACINCHNCKDACPICYCQECFFESTAMRYEADKFLGLGLRLGRARVPYDTLLFHLGRLNHMVSSCVACGACEEACPRDIPVSLLFKRVAENVQNIFNYRAGRSFEEELPLKTFREEELQPR